MKGFSLRSETAEAINFETMKAQVDLFLNGKEAPVEIDNAQIRRKGIGTVTTVHFKKKYRTVFDKRVPFQNYCTVPFGYRGPIPSM